MHAISFENDCLRMEVWPQIGGKVSSLIDKADGYELLFNFPVELPEGPHYDEKYSDHWYCGWDECFPAIAPGNYPSHPYSGIAVPDHGELWGIPTTTAVPTRDGITTVWNGLRFGYRLTRKLYLDGPSVIAEYSLSNLAPFDFRYVWAMHALLSLQIPVKLNANNAHSFMLTHDSDGAATDTAVDWPNTPAGERLSLPHELPQRRGWKLFSQQPISDGFQIVYPTRRRSMQIDYASDSGVAAYWGIWINTGGWEGVHHFAIEPTTGRHDQIDRAIQDDSAGRVEGFGKADWSVTLTLAPTNS
jgi:Domain of unknown function (DUF5107)